MKQNRACFAALPALLLTAGCAGRTPSVLGIKPVQGTPIAINTLKESPNTVLVHGVMVEKCPVAGCWFMLRDATGMIKVDTKAAGFVVTDVPLNTTMTVSGKLKTTGERRIAALGLQY